jgi:hypothetical protein
LSFAAVSFVLLAVAVAASYIPARRAAAMDPLRKLGHDVRDARRRRRIPVAIAAARASISRTTLVKIEKGDPGVGIGIYATVLFVLGMIDRLAELADPTHDSVGASHLVGRLLARARKNKESATFEYVPGWLQHAARFSLEPALTLGPGPFHTPPTRRCSVQ